MYVLLFHFAHMVIVKIVYCLFYSFKAAFWLYLAQGHNLDTFSFGYTSHCIYIEYIS